jgi:hypothetical protein
MYHLELTPKLTNGLYLFRQIVGRVVENCLSDEDGISGCLQKEAAEALGRALRQNEIRIMPGLVLERTSADPPSNPLEDARGMSDPAERLWSNVQKLMATRSININFTDMEGEEELS